MRQKACVAIREHAHHRPMAALRELRSIGRDQQRQVRELWRGHAKTLENEHVLEGIGEVILSADDVADAQIRIVGAGRHVIRRQAIAAEQREILDIVGGLGLCAIDGVVELDYAIRSSRHSKTHDEGLPGGSSAVTLGGA